MGAGPPGLFPRLDVRPAPRGKPLGDKSRAVCGRPWWTSPKGGTTPWKINMEPGNGPSEDDFPLQPGGFMWFSGSLLIFQGVDHRTDSHHESCPTFFTCFTALVVAMDTEWPRNAIIM